MRPKLTPKAQQAMNALGKKSPQACDLFEQTVGQTISKLSMEIEQGNNAVADMEQALRETKENLTKAVGEFNGWANALASYYQSQTQQANGEPAVPVSAPGGTMPPDKATDTQPEPGTDAPGPDPTTPPDGDTKPKD